MLKDVLLVVTCLFVIPVFAIAQQQPPDPAFLQNAVLAIQAQRNLAMDSAAACEAQSRVTADALAKANARIAELEKAAATPDKAEPPPTR